MRAPLRVIITGGGFAAVETGLALRHLARDAVTLTLVAPQDELSYSPAAPGAAFGKATVLRFSLADIARDCGAELRKGTLQAVSPSAQRIRLCDDSWLEYDVLIVAIGARRRVGIPGALTFRDARDQPQLDTLLESVREGNVPRLTIVVPSGPTWSLPAYELALLAAGRAAGSYRGCPVELITAERAPLRVFGREASAAVKQALRDAKVALRMDARPPIVREPGVVGIPQLRGSHIAGLPGDFDGFVAVDSAGAVEGQPAIFAVGDCTSYPVKHGGLATQQADAVARTITLLANGEHRCIDPERVLRARLAGTPKPLYLRAELDEYGDPRPQTSSVSVGSAPWWPDTKVVGVHLSSHLASKSDVLVPT